MNKKKLASLINQPNNQRAFEREACKRSLATFAKRAWRVLEPVDRLEWGWALDFMCAHLEAITTGRLKELTGSNNLLMNVPPGTMKSLLVSVIWPAWEWGPRGLPEHRFLGTSHSQTIATRDSRRCRMLIESEWYQKLWPVALTSDQNQKTKFENDRRGFRESMAFTSMTGARGHRVILDDPISADNANSDAHLEAAKIAFLETLPTRVNNKDSAIVVIMQRLNERDVSGIILEKELNYTHVCLPMRYEPDQKCVSPLGIEDPRTKPGELLFPERFDEEQVSQLEITLGSYGAAGQFQQRPSPRGGGLFKDSWWQYADVPPVLKRRKVFVDTAQKTGQENDFSVFQCWGETSHGQAVLLDMDRGKWEAPELLERARAFWAKQKIDPRTTAPLTEMKIEDKVSGTGLIQTVKREGIPVTAIQRNRDKVSRAYDTAPSVEAGNVTLVRSCPFLSDFLREASSFPAGQHDDTIDPMMDAVADICLGSDVFFFAG